MREIKFIDLFAGIGGFRMGMEMAGHTCVGHCEIDKFARESYEAIYEPGKHEWKADDIRSVDPDDIPYFNAICAGFPCQSFSVAGKRGGFEDTRGTLFFEIARIVRARQPELIFLENVKGLLNHDKGRTLGIILSTLDELGYWWEYQLLNSKSFGVPQNRERIYIIGHLRGRGGRPVFPLSGTDSQVDSKINVMGTIRPHRHSDGDVHGIDGIAPTLTRRDHKDPRLIAIRKEDVPNWIPKEDDINRTLRSGGRSTLSAKHNYDVVAVKQIGNVFPSKTRDNPNQGGVYDQAGLAPSLTTMGGGNRQPMIIDDTYGFENEPRTYEDKAPTLRADRSGLKVAIGASRGRGENYEQQLEINDSGTSNALTSVQKDNLVIENPYRIRKLTPRECWRLQGFPDWAFDKADKVVSDSQLYKQAGNAVTVNVVYEIARRLELD